MLRAVLTGDLELSTTMAADELGFIINALRIEANELQNMGVFSDMAFFRGDGFQVMVKKPQEALRAALILKTAVNRAVFYGKGSKRSKIRYDVAISIGLGEVPDGNTESHLNSRPFILSGRGLDLLKEKKMTLGLFSGHEENDMTYRALFEPFHWIMKHWSLASAELVHHKLKFKTEQEIAPILGISQSAVNQRSQAACWNGLVELLNHYHHIGVKKYG